MGKKNFFEPISGFELPRFAGMPTFMRLPHVDLNHDQITEVDTDSGALSGTAIQNLTDQVIEEIRKRQERR